MVHLAISPHILLENLCQISKPEVSKFSSVSMCAFSANQMIAKNGANFKFFRHTIFAVVNHLT